MKIYEKQEFTGLLSGYVAEWSATDFSPKMVATTKVNIKGKNVIFRTLDATNTCYPDNTFDAVLIANALHIMPSSKQALQEIHRVLKPNGILFAPTFVYDENVPYVRMCFLEKLGFRTYQKWKSGDLTKFVQDSNFKVLSSVVIKANPLSECVLIPEKSTENKFV